MSAIKLEAQAPKNLIQIFILCRDRLNYAREAIGSAIQQDTSEIEVLVSDNSYSDAVFDMVSEEFPEVAYIRRRPALESHQHFRLVMKESDAEFVVFFHDDDILDSDYVRVMRSALEANPDVIAVGCNAKVLRDTTLTDTLYMADLRHDIILTGAEELIDFYLSFNKYRPAPFPGYMYRRSAIEGLYGDFKDGGKYADVTFLMSLIKRGNILWLSKSLMNYRMHGTNDSAVENVGHRLRLLRYIYKNTGISPKSKAVKEFKFRYWSKWWWNEKKRSDTNKHGWRKRVVFAYIFRQALRYLLTQPGLCIQVASRAR